MQTEPPITKNLISETDEATERKPEITIPLFEPKVLVEIDLHPRDTVTDDLWTKVTDSITCAIEGALRYRADEVRFIAGKGLHTPDGKPLTMRPFVSAVLDVLGYYGYLDPFNTGIVVCDMLSYNEEDSDTVREDDSPAVKALHNEFPEFGRSTLVHIAERNVAVGARNNPDLENAKRYGRELRNTLNAIRREFPEAQQEVQLHCAIAGERQQGNEWHCTAKKFILTKRMNKLQQFLDNLGNDFPELSESSLLRIAELSYFRKYDKWDQERGRRFAAVLQQMSQKYVPKFLEDGALKEARQENSLILELSRERPETPLYAIRCVVRDDKSEGKIRDHLATFDAPNAFADDGAS